MYQCMTDLDDLPGETVAVDPPCLDPVLAFLSLEPAEKVLWVVEPPLDHLFCAPVYDLDLARSLEVVQGRLVGVDTGLCAEGAGPPVVAIWVLLSRARPTECRQPSDGRLEAWIRA